MVVLGGVENIIAWSTLSQPPNSFSHLAREQRDCVVEAMMTGETYLAAQACKLASCCLANVAIRLLKAMIAMTGFIRIPSVPVSGGHNDDASAARRVFGRRGLGIAARRWKHTM